MSAKIFFFRIASNALMLGCLLAPSLLTVANAQDPSATAAKQSEPDSHPDIEQQVIER